MLHYDAVSTPTGNETDLAMLRSRSALLSADDLKQLAQAQVERAMLTDNAAERLRMSTLADAMTHVVELKVLLLQYERRLLN